MRTAVRDYHAQCIVSLTHVQQEVQVGLGQYLLVHDRAARRNLSQRFEVATRDGSLDLKQQVLVLRLFSPTRRFRPFVEIDRVYLAAFVEGNDGQRGQVAQEFAQRPFAVIKGNDPLIHQAVRWFYATHNPGQDRRGKREIKGRLDSQGCGHHVGGRTGLAFPFRQLALDVQYTAPSRVED